MFGIICNVDFNSIWGLLGGWFFYVYFFLNMKIIWLFEMLLVSVFMVGGCGLFIVLYVVDWVSI